jgi:hypothetical protein
MVNSGVGLLMNSASSKIGLCPETVIIYENCEHEKTRTRYHAPCMKDGAHLAYSIYSICPTFMVDT